MFEETETVNTVSRVTKEATCDVPGESTWTATFVNKAFEDQSKTEANIPATGHDWEDPVYTLAEDNSSVTATRICATDRTHEERETAVFKLVVAKAPQEEEAGELIYAADFTNPDFERQERQAGTIQPLNELNVLRLPEDLTEIEEEAFVGLACDAVIIPDGCTAIGSRAFAECDSLVYIRIPATVTSLPDDVFEGSENVIIDHLK